MNSKERWSVNLHGILRRAIVGVCIAGPSLAFVACAGNKDYVAPPPRFPADGSQSIERARQIAADAQKAEVAGKQQDAIKLYQEAIQAYRDFPAAWHNLGLVQLQAGQTMAAVESFKTAGDLDQTDPRPPYNIGVVYESLQWATEAQKYYNEALTRDANFQDALRRSVYLDLSENHFTQTTLERIRRGLMGEQDPQWRGFFERSQLRINQYLNPVGADSGGTVTVPTPNNPQHRR